MYSIYPDSEFNSNNLEYYTVDARAKRKIDDLTVDQIFCLYYQLFELDDAIEYTKEFIAEMTERSSRRTI